MKKTPLKRKTPLRKASPKKAAWNRKYYAAKKARLAKQADERGVFYCERCDLEFHVAGSLDGHHPKGQAGANIMEFVLVCRFCHSFFHAYPNEARKQGWIK